MTDGLFKETRPGYVWHTGVSALMAQNTMGVNAVVGYVIDDIYPASCMPADTMEKFPALKNRLVETPLAMAFNTIELFFEWMEKHPDRRNRFHESIRAVNNTGPYSAYVIIRPECLDRSYTGRRMPSILKNKFFSPPFHNCR